MTERRVLTKYGLVDVVVRATPEGHVADLADPARLPVKPLVTGSSAPSEDEAVSQLLRAIESCYPS